MADLRTLVENEVRSSFEEVLSDFEYVTADRDDDVGSDDRPPTAVFAEGDDGVVAWVVRGTHTKHWPGIGAASNRRVVVRGVTLVSDVDTEPQSFVIIDWAEVLAQLGLLVVDRPVEVDEELPTA